MAVQRFYSSAAATSILLAAAAAAPAATYDWLPALGDGSWNDAGNWLNNGTAATQPPGASDAVRFTTVNGTTPTTAHTVTVPTDVTVTGLSIARTALTLSVPVGSSLSVTGESTAPSASLTLNSGTLNAAGTVTANRVFYNGGLVNGVVTLNATPYVNGLRIAPTSTLTGTFRFLGTSNVSTTTGVAANVASGITLNARASVTSPLGNTVNLSTGSAFGSVSNAGTVTLDADAAANNSVVTFNAANTTPGSYGTFYNNSGASLNLNAGGTGTNTRNFNGAVYNYGGAVNVAANVTGNVSQMIDNNGSGVVTVAAGATLNVPTYTQSSSTAATNVAGSLVAADVSITGGALTGTVTLAGTNYNGTRRLTLGSSNSALGTPTFDFRGGGEVAGSGGGAAVQAGVTLLTRASAAAPTPELKQLTNSAYGSASNAGTITLDADAAVADSVVTLSVANTTAGSYGTLYNNNGAVINLNAGGSGTNTRNVNGAAYNYGGTVNVAAGVAANFSQTLDNNGSGVINVAAGATLTVPIFTQSSSTAVTNITGRLAAADFGYTGGTVNGTVTLAGTNYNGTRRLTLGSSFATPPTTAFVFENGGEVAGSSGGASVPGGISLSTRASAATPAAELKLLTGSSYGSASNAGTITLDADAASNNSAVTLSVANTTAGSYGTLYNNNGATLNLNAGGSGTNIRSVNGSVYNYGGTINVGAGAAAVFSQALDNNGSGTVNIAAGSTLTVPTFTQSSSTAVTNVVGALRVADIGFTGGRINGTVDLVGANYNGTRRLTLGTSSLGTAAFTFQGGGEVAGTGGGASIPNGITITHRATAAAPVAELKLSTGSSFGSVSNAGVITLAADAAANNSVLTLSVANTTAGSYGTLYNNNGAVINLNAGGGGTNTRNVNGSVYNYGGTINVASSVAANFSQQLDNNGSGTVNVAAGATLGVPTYTQSSSTAVTNINGKLTAADFGYTGGTVNGTVSLAGTNYNVTRRLTLGTFGSSTTAAFTLQGGGEVVGTSGGVSVSSGISITGRATAAAPTAELKLSTGSSFGSASNAGVITLAADAAANNSTVALSVANTTAGSYGTLYNNNGGVLNLNAGGTGTNTRSINGSVYNYGGTINVAAGVTASASQTVDNLGTVNVASGASLSAAVFGNANSASVTIVDGTLTATDVVYTDGAIYGTVNLAGTNYNGTRRLTLAGNGLSLGTATFVLQGGGEVVNSGTARLPGAVTVIARATAATPTAELKLPGGSSFNVSGDLVIDAAADANNSVVTLGVPLNANTYGQIFNAGTIELNAGGVGTNTRIVKGSLLNTIAGYVTVNAPTTFDRVENRGVLTLNAVATFNQVVLNQPGATLNINATPNFLAGLTNSGTVNVNTAPPAGGSSAEPVNVPYAIGGTGAFTQSGSGTTVLSGANTYTGATVVANDSGTLRATPAAYDNVLNNAGGLDVKAGTFVFDYGTGSRPGPIASSAASPVAQVKSILDAAAPGGFVTGQIRSSGLTNGRTLGYGDTGSGVVVRVTFAGDANLDGQVDFNDFLSLQAHFGEAATRFDQGNFNYDGLTNFNDFLLLQANFGRSVTAANVSFTSEQVGLMNAFFAAETTEVPEPAGLAVAALGAACLTRRRRV